MLQIFTSVKQLDFRQLCDVYSDALLKAGKEKYAFLCENLQLLEAEQDFYQYVSLFLRDPLSFCAVWAVDGVYQSALRIEPYRDGVLLTGLETAFQSRRKGYAARLVKETLTHLSGKGIQKVYSHIHNKNVPSVKTHLKCGFEKIFDYAAFVDGSVDHRSYTYLKLLANLPSDLM